MSPAEILKKFRSVFRKSAPSAADVQAMLDEARQVLDASLEAYEAARAAHRANILTATEAEAAKLAQALDDARSAMEDATATVEALELELPKAQARDKAGRRAAIVAELEALAAEGAELIAAYTEQATALATTAARAREVEERVDDLRSEHASLTAKPDAEGITERMGFAPDISVDLPPFRKLRIPAVSDADYDIWEADRPISLPPLPRR